MLSDRNSVEKFQCFSLTTKNIIVLFFTYDVCYHLCLALFRGHLGTCFAIAALAALCTFFFIAWQKYKQVEDDEKFERHFDIENIQATIKNEYQKIHKRRRKNELLAQVGQIHPNRIELPDDSEEDIFTRHVHSVDGIVHVNYLNRHVSTNEIRPTPQGDNLTQSVDGEKRE